MGITNVNKEINLSNINCNEIIKVTLAITASPNILSNPSDIVLILDKSGSMEGTALENLKLGANKFIDIIDEATDNIKDGNIGSGSRLGIVSFSDIATQNTQLITSVDVLKNSVNSLIADGYTNHADAFEKAIELFDLNSNKGKVIVMFTDGKTTIGQPPNIFAEKAKSYGINIYCIGLLGDSGIDTLSLNNWASDPDESFVAITPDSKDLEKLFENLALNISKPGATNISIDEIINPEFSIINILEPNKGVATIINSNTINWKISELGTNKTEGAKLEFFIKYISNSSGTKIINKSIYYKDNENNVVTFPSPSVYVDCGTVIKPDYCPIPIELSTDNCKDNIKINAGDIYISSTGQILEFDATIKNVCPKKRLALATILTELDGNLIEHKRGMKMFTIPAHNYPDCKDLIIKNIKFILPDDINLSNCQGQRNLKIQFITHYIDNDYNNCQNNNII